MPHKTFRVLNTHVLDTKGFSVIARQDAPRNTWHFVRRKEGVAVLPITEDGKIIFVRQLRPAVGRELLEIPAGGIDREVIPAHEALRELREETGYTTETVESLGTYFVSPGYYTERVHLFVARKATRAGGSQRTNAEKINKLTVVLRSLPWAYQALYEGTFEDAKTACAVSMFFIRTMGLPIGNPMLRK